MHRNFSSFLFKKCTTMFKEVNTDKSEQKVPTRKKSPNTITQNYYASFFCLELHRVIS